MNKQDFTACITVDHTPQEVFNSINNVRGWWQGEIEGNTNRLNDEFTYRFADVHESKQRIIELVPDKKVVWLVTESNLGFIKDKNEWAGTKIIFEISEKDPVSDTTEVHFTHKGLHSGIECFGECSNAWSQLIKQSLFILIKTGHGVNVF